MSKPKVENEVKFEIWARKQLISYLDADVLYSLSTQI